MSETGRRSFARHLVLMGFKKDTSPGLGRDPLMYTKTVADTDDAFRTVDVQLWRDGLMRASHMLNGCEDTHPTKFKDIEGMRKAVERETVRMDHPRWTRPDGSGKERKWYHGIKPRT